MHYGHPDVFDRIFHITRGGISKPSKQINLSEDIFAGSVSSSLCFFIILLLFAYFSLFRLKPFSGF